MTLTFSETLHDGFHQAFEVTATIANERTDFQHVQIFDTARLGRVLVLDGIVQLTTLDEFCYSEMLAHMPLFELLATGEPAGRVLIVGGGDGAIAEEVLKHKTVKEVVMAEIDGRVVDLCKTHFKDVHRGAFDDPRFTLALGDAFEYLGREASADQFDVIIADRPDPVGPAGVLFADDFYKAVSRALSPRGIAVFQTGVPALQPGELADTLPQLRRAFGSAGVYLTAVPTYVGGLMALTFAANGTPPGDVSDTVLARLFETLEIPTDYYSPAIHKAAFALPPFMERIAGGARLMPGEKPQIVKAV